jgi:hypothetical protein
VVRYEDFAADPGATLQQVGRLTGLDFSSLARSLESGDPLSPQHNIAGNRVRMDGAIRLRLDERWKTNLSAADRRIFNALAGRALRRFGYSLRPQGRSARVRG